jgi:hypothetical protein
MAGAKLVVNDVAGYLFPVRKVFSRKSLGINSAAIRLSRTMLRAELLACPAILILSGQPPYPMEIAA